MSERMSRRQFLKLSGAVTGSAALAGVGRAARAVVPPEASILPETQVPQVPQVSQEIQARQETKEAVKRKEIEVAFSLEKPTWVEGKDDKHYVFGIKKEGENSFLVRYDEGNPDVETKIIETDQYCVVVNPDSTDGNESGIEILASIKASNGKENVFWGEGVDPSLWFRVGRSGYFPKEMKLAFAKIEGENKKRRVFAAIKQYEENGERKVFLGVEGDALAQRAQIQKEIKQQEESKAQGTSDQEEAEQKIVIGKSQYSVTRSLETGKTFVEEKDDTGNIGFFVEQEIGVLYGAKKLEMLCHDSKIHLAIISDYSNPDVNYKENEGWLTYASIQKVEQGVVIDYNKAAFAFGVYSGKRGESHFVDQPHLFPVPGAVGISYITEKENGKYEFWLTIAVPGGSTKWQRKRREPEDQAKAKSPRISTKYIDDRGEIKEIEAASEANIKESFAQLGLETQNYYLFYDFLVKDGINRDDLTGSTELNGTPFAGRLTEEGGLEIFRAKGDSNSYKIIASQTLPFTNITSFEITPSEDGNLLAVYMEMDNGQKKIVREKIIVREKTFFPTLFQAFLGLFSSA